ncbi:hypothetical protein Tco_0686186 [Tanacetum coccineum]
MSLGYQNPFYLKQAQQKQQILYNGKVLLEKHDPPTVYDSEETLELAQESSLKMQLLNKEIKPANYTKINHLSGVFVSQTAKSREELYLSNTFNMDNVSKSISIPNEEFSDDTTSSVARKFLNEIHKIVKDENFPIVNQVDARVQDFEIQFLQEAAKFVRDFQSLANEADESLAKNKALELEVERLLRAVNKLHDTIYENAKLRAQLFDKVSDQKDTSKDNLMHFNMNVKMLQKLEFLKKVDKMHDLSNPVTSNSIPTTKESKVVDNDKVIAPGMFRINSFMNSREEILVPNKPTKASVRTHPISVSQPQVIIKKVVNFDSNGFSSTGVDITTKTRLPQPRSNTKNDRVPSASKSSRIKNKEVDVEDHPRNLMLSKNKKHMSSECNNIKLAIRNDKSEIVCAMCKQCLVTANHDDTPLTYFLLI